MPSLYVQRDQTQELVNYQARGDYYVVDRLYSAAALTEGVGTEVRPSTSKRCGRTDGGQSINRTPAGAGRVPG